MATVIDLLQHLGERAAPEGENALAGHVMLPGSADTPLSLPLAANLVTAWSEAVGRTTLGHHALALSAVQAGHAVALMGHGIAPHADLLLLTLSRLRFEQTALWVTQTRDDPLRAKIIELADQLGIRWLDAGAPGSRMNKAHLLLATPHDLHNRLLQFHDRGWRWIWPRLRLIALPAIHTYNEARGGHIRWLLRRIERLSDVSINYLASLAPVADVEGTLERVVGRTVHVIAAPSGPSQTTLAAVWRSDADRTATMRQLVDQLQKRRLAVTVLGRTEAETEQLRAALGISEPESQQQDARVAIVSGVPSAVDARQGLLRQGYRLLVLLAGDEPHEQLIAAQPNLLLQALPHWPIAAANPYIATEHLACAATELPLTEAEIDQWHMRDLRDRLIKKGALLGLPSGDLWQSAPTTDDHYRAIDPMTIGGPPWNVYNPKNELVGAVSPAQLDWCVLPGQVYAQGLRVAQRDDATRTVRLVNDNAKHTTLVISDIAITVREELAARSIRFGKITSDLTRGKVIVSQHVVGLWDIAADGTERRTRIDTSDGTQWTAASCWIALPAPPSKPETVGWAIRQTLPFVMLSVPCALGVTYDAALQRLFIFETEPGGVGVIECMYDQFERVIELAHQLVQACVNQPLYGHIARSERVWLDGLRGIRVVVPTVETPPVVVPQPKRKTHQYQQPLVAERAASTPEAQPTPLPTFSKPAARPQIYTLPSQPAKPAAQSHEHARPAASAVSDERASVALRPAPIVPFQPAASVVPPKIVEPEPVLQPEQDVPTQAADNLVVDQPVTEQRSLSNVLAEIDDIADADRQFESMQSVPNEQHAVSDSVIAAQEAQDTPQHNDDENIGLGAPDDRQLEQPVARAEFVLRPIQTDVGAIPLQEEPEHTSQETSVQHIDNTPPQRKQPQRLPSQFLIDDLLPPIEEPDGVQHIADGEDDETADEQVPEIAPIVELRPRPRTAQSQQQERHEPREPLPFRRPERGSSRDNRASRAGQQEARYSAQQRTGKPDRGPKQPQSFSSPQHIQRDDQTTRSAEEQAPQRQASAAQGSRRPPHGTARSSNTEPQRTSFRSNQAASKPPQQNQQPQGQRDRQPPSRLDQREQPDPQSAESTTDDSSANVGNMIARMRRLREQREAEQARQRPQAQAARISSPQEAVELRFHIGERVQCLPYGIGTVRASKLIEDREMVIIDFPDYGEIEVDPGVSLVRKVSSEQAPTQQWSDDLL